MLCLFLLCSKGNQLYVYIYPFFFGFPSYLGQHSTEYSFLYYGIGSYQLSILYIEPIVHICQFQSPNSSHLPFPP